MPVYNGAKYLAEAIESVLAQTFRDFELLISDDGSSDQTAAIATRYARQDRRIVFSRNPHNLGLGRNFDHTLAQARGTYFKWLAQDDIILPEYLEKCVGLLEAADDVVLAHSLILIQRDGQRSAYAGIPLHTCASPAQRFGLVVLERHWNLEIMALMRRQALLGTRGHQSYFGSDRALIAHLALLGRFALVEEPLFVNRDHPERVMRRYSFTDRLWFHDPARASRPVLPQWSAYRDYWRAVQETELPPVERARCWGILLQWWLANWNLGRVGIDLLAKVTPALADPLFRWRDKHYHRRGIGVRAAPALARARKRALSR